MPLVQSPEGTCCSLPRDTTWCQLTDWVWVIMKPGWEGTSRPRVLWNAIHLTKGFLWAEILERKGHSSKMGVRKVLPTQGNVVYFPRLWIQAVKSKPLPASLSGRTALHFTSASSLLCCFLTHGPKFPECCCALSVLGGRECEKVHTHHFLPSQDSVWDSNHVLHLGFSLDWF